MAQPPVDIREATGVEIAFIMVNGAVLSTANPLPTAGGAGSAGSITAAGTNGALAQAVQGITGGVPQPVSFATQPLPTGAATAANQTAALPAGTNTIGGVVPLMGSGGMLAVATTATGANFILLASQACKQVTIANNTGVIIEIQQGAAGVALPIFVGSYFTFFGLTNANQLGMRRNDQAATVVTAQARWEN